jgi:hypothetical protein
MISSKRVYDLLFSSLRRLGVAALGDTVAADVAQEALLELNSIRAGYSLGNKNNELFDQTYTATENRLVITLGTDGITPGDIPIRPAKIQQVVVMNNTASGINIPVALRSYAEYRTIAVQNIAAIPDSAYIDTGYPYQRMYFFPGLTSGWAVRVQGMAYMDEYEALDDPFMDPSEYFAVLDLDLTLRLAVKWGIDLPPAVYAQLQSVLKPLKTVQFMARLHNAPNGLKSSGAGINFFSGMPN